MPTVSFYRTSAGKDIVLDLIREFAREDRRVIGEDLKVLELRFPLGMPLSKNLGSGLSELRSSLPSRREFRLFYGYDRRRATIWILHGFVKKSQKTPDRELQIARDRLAEVLRE